MDIESKVRVTSTITTLLLGPLDIGSQIVGKEGVLEMMLVMAQSDDLLQQVHIAHQTPDSKIWKKFHSQFKRFC